MLSSSRFRDPLPPPLPRTQPRLDLPRYPSPQETARQPFTGMKGNPVHVVVDEGWDLLFCIELTLCRTIFNPTQMDKVRYVLWAYSIFRFFSRFDHGGNYWSFEIDARPRGSKVDSDRTAGQIQ